MSRLTRREEHPQPLGDCRDGEGPADEDSSPPLNQEHGSFAHQIVDLDGEQGEEQHEEDCEAEDDRPSPGVAEKRPHGEQAHDRDQERGVSSREEIPADRFWPSHQNTVTGPTRRPMVS